MQGETKIDAKHFPDVEKQGWDAEKIAEESANKSSDEIVKQMQRGNESEESTDNQDTVGGVELKDTPRGREETKK